MVNGAAILKKQINYNPKRFNQMVAEHGGVEAAKRLLNGSPFETSDGFTTLYEAKRLEMSAEAHALLPWYEHLFTQSELENARYRLTEHRFDIDKYLREASEKSPTWSASGKTDDVS